VVLQRDEGKSASTIGEYLYLQCLIKEQSQRSDRFTVIDSVHATTRSANLLGTSLLRSSSLRALRVLPLKLYSSDTLCRDTHTFKALVHIRTKNLFGRLYDAIVMQVESCQQLRPIKLAYFATSLIEYIFAIQTERSGLIRFDGFLPQHQREANTAFRTAFGIQRV